MKKLLLSALFLGCIISISFAQKNKVFTIEGTVVSKETGVPIPFAQIVLIEINQWGFTNEKGHFKIGGVFKGNYTLQSSALGYVYYKIPVTIANNVASLKIQMLPDNLTINKVVVTAERGGTINSSNKIDKKAIEHVQASSIADVMQLLPGGIITNTNLLVPNNIKIRTISDDKSDNNARGVGFMINGSQISSDASMGGGIMDFRNYSTDNIESIQILKGVVSAEYGDISSGTIMVTTKAGRTPYEIRIKVDPKLKAVSANKGLRLTKNGGYVNIDFDYARATNDLRSPVKTFDRANVGLTYSNTFNNKLRPFRFNARLAGSFIANSIKYDSDVSKDDFTKVRDKNIMLSLYGNWMINAAWISTLTYNVSASYAYNTTRDYLVNTANILPTTNTLKEGLGVGYFTSQNVIRDERIEDVPVYVNAKLSGNLNKKWDGTLFKTILGFEWNSKGNCGDGIYYEGMQPQYFRERKYSDTPFMNSFSAFLEEKILIPISKTSLEFSAGVRFTKMMIKGYSYNPVFDPRLNVKYTIIKGMGKDFIKNFALRGGWGIMQKLPSISLLYPGEIYLDKETFLYNSNNLGESLAIINTTILPNKLNYNIATAKNRSIEFGADLNIGGVDIGITYFNEHLKDGVSQNYNIKRETLKKYNSVTDQNSAPKFEDEKVWIKDKTGEYVEARYRMVNEFIKYLTPDSRAEQSKWGIEYELNFGKIKPVNTSIIVNGAYIKTKNSIGGTSTFYVGGVDPVNQQNEFPYVSIFTGDCSSLSSANIRERLSTNISLVTNIPKIRMVVSLTTQCIWMEKGYNDYNADNIYTVDGQLYRNPIAYVDFNGNTKPFTNYNTTTDKDLRLRLSQMRLTTHLPYYYAVESYKPYFMANIRVTKEIGKLATISFYANNFTNSKPIMVDSARPNVHGVRKNTDIYFGAELRLTL
ncbi:MAG: TonB-dependent receptor [Bacteroidales bacterium]